MNGFSYGTDYGLGDTFGKYGGYGTDLNISYTAPTKGFGSRLKNAFGGGNMLGALIGGGFGLAGNIYAANKAAAGTQAMLAAQADNLKRNIQENRAARAANLGKFISQNVMDYGTGADLELGRQLFATEYDRTRGRDLDRDAAMKDFKAQVAMREDPTFRGQQQRRFRRGLEQARVERQAAMEGMFGKIV